MRQHSKKIWMLTLLKGDLENKNDATVVAAVMILEVVNN